MSCPHGTFRRGSIAFHMDCVTWNKEDEGKITEVKITRVYGGNWFNYRTPDGNCYGGQRYPEGDYPTNLFHTREEAERLYQTVLERRAGAHADRISLANK